MVFFKEVSKAALACIAVEEVLPPANPAYSAFFAVENLLPFILIVKQVANGTKVPSKLDFAVLATFLAWLYYPTVQAPNLLDCMPVDLVILFGIHLRLELDLVVAKPACEKLVTLWTLELASPTVVLATKFGVA